MSKVNDPINKPDTYTYQIHHLLNDDDTIIHDVKPEDRDVVLKALGRYISPNAATKQLQQALKK